MKLRLIRDWSKIVKSPEIEPSKSSDNTSEGNSENKDTGRRLLDTLISKDPSRNFNVDRRTKGSDRRGNIDPNYTGPVRRNTIDRRLNLKDRREKEQLF